MDAPRAPLSLRFGRFAFDEADARLLADGRPIALAPKAFGVLAELLSHAGQLVTKDALLDAVWGHRHVSVSVLKTTISELRAALGDDAKSPMWVETASRRGYRFVGIVGDMGPTDRSTSAPVQVLSPLASPELIGRQAGLARLQAAWLRATGSQRQLCCIAGEAGIGKTSLVDAFVAAVGDAAVAHGQCIEQVGQGEPYLPVLEALAALARSDAALLELLRRVAPTWLLQLPWLIEPAEQARLRDSLASSTQDRMLREFSELIEQYTATRTLLLITEDLHWCDEATVRLLDHVARRRQPARLMWLASYRTPELVAEGHPLNGVRHELRARRLCDEILLDPFTEAELGAYLAQHHPGLSADEARIRRLHRQTDGVPLFVANAVDEIATAAHEGEAVDEWAVPDSLAGIVVRQRSRLAPETATLLEAAAVCGVEFEASIVAAMLGQDADAVMAQCDSLARQQVWVAPSALQTLADGTLDARFAFRHALYRQVLYRHMSPPARAALHRRAAAAIDEVHASRLDEYASTLALHHERGLDPLAAMRAYAIASERALGRFAPREALLLADRGLALLARGPAGDARNEAELALQHLRVSSLTQSAGATTPEGRDACRRCAELFEQLPQTPARAWILTGPLWMLVASGEYDAAEQTARRLRAAADAFDDGMLQLSAAVSLAATLLQRGRIAEAAALIAEAHALTQHVAEDRLPTTLAHDPIALTLGVGATIHAMRGDAEQALRWAEAAVERAAQLGRPMVRGFAARCASMVDIRFGRAQAVLSRTKDMRAIVSEHGIAPGLGPTLALLGWALAHTGDALEGLRQIEQGCTLHAAAGTLFDAANLQRLAAESALAANDLAAARRHIDAGFAMAERTGEELHLPDLWMLRSLWAARTGDVAGARLASETSARLAGAAGALTVELIARLALCELPAATTADLDALREVRSRWHDTTPWPALARIDRLLAGP